MRVVMTLLVRDEEDIIKQNILYHLQCGVEYVIATDNNSVDGTMDILREFELQGVLHLITEKQDNYAQSVWVSRMAQLAKDSFNADWVINNDADEFWWPLSGNLVEALQGIPPEYDIVSASRHNFIPFTEKNTKWYEHMTFREVNSTNPLGKPLPSKICHRGIENIKVAQGNHRVTWPQELPVYDKNPIEILHFPMRSYAQFENKIIKGGAAYERNNDLPKYTGDAWRQLYDLWKDNKLRDYYEQQVWDNERLQEGLQNSLIIHDSKLKDFFNIHSIT